MLRSPLLVAILAVGASALSTTSPLLVAPKDRLLALRGGVLTPKETYSGYAKKGAAGATMETAKSMHSGFLAGMFVGFGGLLALTVAGGCSGLDIVAKKLVFAALFPYTMYVILAGGGQLYTGNAGAMTAAYLEGLIPLWRVFRGLGVALAGNVIGCLLFAVLAYFNGMPASTAELVATFTEKKLSLPLGVVLLKSVLCNWLVCLAIFLSGAASDVAGKILAFYFPIFAFIILGLEHSVANAFILPLGYLAGAKVNMMDIVTKNLLPVLVGNGIGGALLVAATYSYQYGKLGGTKIE